MQKHLSLSAENLGDKGDILVKFSGEFDKAGQTEVREELKKVVNDFKGSALVFDLTNMKFINSEGIGYFMEIHTHLVTAGKKLVLVAPNAHVADVFNTIGMTEIMPVLESLSDYLNKK